MASIIGEKVSKKKMDRPVCGIIRPGTKIPTKKTRENAKAMVIFQRVVNGEINFRDAEKEISKNCGIDHPFFPRNPEHFNVAPQDFGGGVEAVQRLLDLYGEMRPGDDMKKLYSFPIVFPDSGSADAAIPSRFEVNSGPIKYHSQESDDGETRHCVYLKPVSPSDVLQQRAQRIKQVAPRELSIRGVCEPSKCPEYACGVCKFKGTVEFYIPGLTGGLIRMSTSSTYAAVEMWMEVDNLYKQHGRLPNFTPKGDPVFSLTKQKRVRNYFGEDGKECKGEQWVPVLNAKIDISSVMRIQEVRRLRIAMDIDEGVVVAPKPIGAPMAWLAPVAKVAQLPAVQTSGEANQPVSNEESGEINFESHQPKAGAASNSNEFSDLDLVLNLVDKFSVADEFEQWVKAKHGAEWDSDANIVIVLAELTALTTRMDAQCLPLILSLNGLLYANGVPVTEVGLPYLKHKFGNGLMRDRESLEAARVHLIDLLESGAEVALAFMKQAVAQAA